MGLNMLSTAESEYEMMRFYSIYDLDTNLNNKVRIPTTV